MIFMSHADRAKALLLAAGLTFALISPAPAQWPQMDQVQQASASLQAAVAPPLTDEEISKLDWSQLDVDASTSREALAAKARAAKAAASDGTTWTNNNQPNGASAVSVKEKISPFWDTRVGA